MRSLRTMLMGGVAAVALIATPTLAQETANPDAATPNVAASERSYDDAYGDGFSDWADRPVSELLGQSVVNDAGESIGDISDFGLAEDQIVAIVGIGGFLGMGEHEVAIPIEQFSVEGDQLVLAGVTREQLEAMPEYDEDDAQTFASDQTFRSGYETTMPGLGAGGMTDTAGTAEPMDPAAADVAETDTAEQPMAEEEVAETEMPTAEEEVAEAEAAEDAMTEAPAAETDMAETDVAEEPAVDTEMAESEAETEAPLAGEAELAEAEDATGWTDEMDGIFADIADREIAELIGMDVASAEGEVVGEIDNFALEGQDVVAIVGVGGFLGIGEHDVALSLGDMTYDGEKLVLSAMTEEQLRELPEYDANEANYLPQEGTLRSTYDQ